MESLLKLQPVNVDALNIAAACARSLGQVAKAEKYLTSAIRLKPDFADAHNNLGSLLHSLNRLDEAQAFYQRAIAARPEFADAYFNLGLLHHSTDRFDDAEMAYRRAIELRPDYAEAHMNLGNILKLKNRYSECESAYRNAVTVRPAYAQAHNNLGLLLHHLKRFSEAEAAYRIALAVQSDYTDALCNLGALFMEEGRFPEAEVAFRQTLAVQPASVKAAHNLGKLFHILNRHADAEEAYNYALTIKSDNADVLCDLGSLYSENDRLAEAEAAYLRAITYRPDHVLAHCNLGNLLNRLERSSEAEDAYRMAMSLQPDFANAYFNLGNLLMGDNRVAEAEASYRRVLELCPDHIDALNNLGLILHMHKRHGEAEDAFRHALAIRPDYSDAYNNLGLLLADLKRTQAAEAAYRQAVTIRPDFAEAHNNLGLLLVDLKRVQEAEAAYRQAVAIHPGFSEVHNNLGILLVNCERFSDAETAFRSAAACKPDNGYSVGQIDHMMRYQCAWASLSESEKAITSLLATDRATGVSPFALLAIPDISPLQQRQAGKMFAEKYLHADLPIIPLRAEAASKNRLRIGYLSEDFHEHATAWLLAGVLERHDRSSLSVFAYSYGPDCEAPIRQRLISACERFRDIRSLSDQDAARQIAEDEIDILVDLKGYTGNTRLGIPALRPAPVIVSWLGYPGTLGDSRLADFIIGDPVVTPLSHAGHFSEALALMPHCYQPTDRERAIGNKPTRAEAGLPESGFVFCSFNQSYKFNPQMFSLWCRLMEQVPHSVLWLLEPNSAAIANLRTEAVARGIDPSRLIFAPKRPQTDHLGRLQLADLALDTFPCTSHTTGSDALWAGVPLVTKIGETFASRVAASLLYAAGLPELVTTSDSSYFDLALTLAQHPDHLAAIRKKLHTGRTESRLFNSARFAKDLERIYFAIWAQHAAGEKSSFALAPSA